MLLRRVRLAGALALASVPAFAEDTDPLAHTMDVRIDLRDPASGWLGMSATFHDVDRRDLGFRQLGNQAEVALEDVAFAGVNGPIEATLDGRVWTLIDPPAEGPITATWRAKPGGMGRHGHQGWVAPDWASFDGRVLLLPMSRRSVRTARFEILRPDGWEVVHPWAEQDGRLVAHDAGHLKSMVTSTCIAVGDYDVRTKQIGGTEVRVGSPASWDQAHRDALAEKSFAMFTWFHEELGFDRRAPFAVAWLPTVNGEEQVFGGASVNGACYEHPTESARNWLLLGHRIGHPMNRYTPAGMSLRDSQDRWFAEGWASYIEVVAAAGSGALPDQTFWNAMYRRYIGHLAQHPEHDVPLRDEPKHGEASEFLHYTKGPLVVKALDDLMKRRSGVGMEPFMRAMWEKYGFHKASFPLREEIEAFTGDSYDDFWAVFVDDVGTLYPMWPEAADEVLAARTDAAPAGWVGDRPIHPEFLFWLAWSGTFERYADIAAFLQESSHHAAILESRGLTLLPADVQALRYGMPSMAQYSIARTELDWPAHEVQARAGCWGVGDPSMPALRWSDSPVGQTFARLLELEAAYEAKTGRSVGAVGFTVGKTRRLGVGPHDRVTVHSTFTTPPPRVGVELQVDGVTTHARQVTMDPTWTNTRVTFEPAHRPVDASILLFRVGPDALPQVERPLWQMPAPFTRSAAKVPGPAPQDTDPPEPDGEAAEPAE